jgi:hypothetical protein
MINTSSSDITIILEPFLNQIAEFTEVVQALQAQINKVWNQILTSTNK